MEDRYDCYRFYFAAVGESPTQVLRPKVVCPGYFLRTVKTDTKYELAPLAPVQYEVRRASALAPYFEVPVSCTPSYCINYVNREYSHQ